MSTEVVETKRPIEDGTTKDQIDRLIKRRKKKGIECEVVDEDGKRFLICRYKKP